MNGAPAIQFGGLELGLIGIGVIFSLIALVTGIIVCVKMFQNDQTALGVISLILMFCTGIGYLIILVFGWMKSSEWNIKGLMTTYTVSMLLGMVLAGAGYGMFIARLAKEVQNNPQFQREMEQLKLEIEQ